MGTTILKAEGVSKQYRLGLVGKATLRDDFARFLAKIQGRPDPFLKVGVRNDRSTTSNDAYVWALRDINFSVERGEVLGIIGKNGAGKSTLLKILSRVTAPTTGTIKSRGRIASLLEVGTGFNPELTGRENIYLNGAILGMTKAEITSKLDEIIAFSGCERYIDTPTKRYSSGMTVRLAFAVAAHLEPEILVVDEVLAVGDAEFQKKAIGKMQDIARGEGRTVLFVSHNMGSIQSLCTRAILLENGCTVSNGEVKEVIEKYLTSQQNEKDLELIKQINTEERSGNMEVSIKEVELIPARTRNFPMTGAPLTFKFYLENPNGARTGDIRLDFRVDDYLGQRLLWFSTAVFDTVGDEVARSISFHIDKLQLNFGNYMVTTHLTVKNEVADWARNAFRFRVEEGFFYDSLRRVDTVQSKILTDFELAFNDC